MCCAVLLFTVCCGNVRIHACIIIVPQTAHVSIISAESPNRLGNRMFN